MKETEVFNRLGIVFWQEESIGKERILKISDSRYHRYISFVDNTNSHPIC